MCCYPRLVYAFQKSRLVHKPVAFSDHLALSLQVEAHVKGRSRKRKSFKLEEMWFRSPESHLIVSKSWTSGKQELRPQQNFLTKIGRVTNDLKNWASQNFGALSAQASPLKIGSDSLCLLILSGGIVTTSSTARKAGNMIRWTG